MIMLSRHKLVLEKYLASETKISSSPMRDGFYFVGLSVIVLFFITYGYLKDSFFTLYLLFVIMPMNLLSYRSYHENSINNAMLKRFKEIKLEEN